MSAALHVILSYFSAEHIGVLYPGFTFLLLGKYWGQCPNLPVVSGGHVPSVVSKRNTPSPSTVAPSADHALEGAIGQSGNPDFKLPIWPDKVVGSPKISVI